MLAITSVGCCPVVIAFAPVQVVVVRVPEFTVMPLQDVTFVPLICKEIVNDGVPVPPV